MDAIEQVYSRIRLAQRRDLARRVSEAYALAPRLSLLDGERSRLIADAGARRLSPEDAMERLHRISAEEQSILSDLGLPGDTLSLRYRCEKCRDTGYLGTAPKQPCPCRLLIRESLAGEAGINNRETFPRFSEDVYPDEVQKKRAVNARKLCESYAAALPRPEKPNLLLLGMPGLGKSYLGNAVAYEAIRSGMDSVKVTAYRFLQDVMEDIRARTDRAKRYQTVPLLVLDDLGSEPEIPNVSTEWLFAVVNERAVAKRPTVCISNLSLGELQARYGERVLSRICDRNTTLCLQLTGANLRTL